MFPRLKSPETQPLTGHEKMAHEFITHCFNEIRALQALLDHPPLSLTVPDCHLIEKYLTYLRKRLLDVYGVSEGMFDLHGFLPSSIILTKGQTLPQTIVGMAHLFHNYSAEGEHLKIQTDVLQNEFSSNERKRLLKITSDFVESFIRGAQYQEQATRNLPRRGKRSILR